MSRYKHGPGESLLRVRGLTAPTSVTSRGPLIALLALILPSCAQDAALRPESPAARDIALLWWIMFVLATLVVVAVLYFLWSATRRTGELRLETNRLFLRWGIAGPALILLIVLAASVATSARVSRDSTSGSLTIEVVGHQWWWEVRYPQQGIVTANEIHMPAGEPVSFKVTSNDVIHSLWVPRLGGKIDMNPGDENEIVLQADSPGTYRGMCAEFCGLQHAKMEFLVVAQDAQSFDQWIDEQARSARPVVTVSEQAGEQVFLGSACVYCHTIEGTAASGKVGPDLTHLASRRTLGAGQVPNTRGHLAGWILDPQSVKPGNRMPPTNLSGPELQSILDYLESLE